MNFWDASCNGQYMTVVYYVYLFMYLCASVIFAHSLGVTNDTSLES